MRQFSPLFWHCAPDVGGATRFSVGACETASTAPARDEDRPLESLRCDVMIALSNLLTQAAIDHPHLAPFLMDGLDNALERLQGARHENDLHSIQQWLTAEQKIEKNLKLWKKSATTWNRRL